MRSFLRSATAMKWTAMVLLLLAMVVSAVLYYGSRKAVAIQGPGVLQAVSTDRIWLGVNNELWVLDSQGRMLARKSGLDFGFDRGIANIAPAPGGRALLSARGDARWKVVDVSDMAILNTISPDWPSDFHQSLASGNHLAVAPNGDVAIATGGMHAVLLFDAQGKLKARTSPGSYRFTNGIWHDTNGWWTTDTNRFFLRFLDSETLKETDTVQLKDSGNGYLYLGELQPSRGAANATTGKKPLTTITRLNNEMQSGQVVDVFHDGTQVIYNPQPMYWIPDFTWFNDQLLVVDAGSFQIRRYSTNRQELEPFGDAQVRQELQHMLEQRIFWAYWTSRPAFVVALCLLLAGILAYQRHKKLLLLTALDARKPIVISKLSASTWTRLRQWAWVFGWPILIRVLLGIPLVLMLNYLVVSAYGDGLRPGDAVLSLLPWLGLVYLVLLGFIVSVTYWQRQRYWKLSAQPEYEDLLNGQAIVWLRDSAVWEAVKHENETPRETLHVRSVGWWRRSWWLLVTSERVLLFAVNAREKRLLSEWPRSSIVSAETSASENVTTPSQSSHWRNVFWDAANLRLQFSNGEHFEGTCLSLSSANRVVEVLRQSLRPSRKRPVAAKQAMVSTVQKSIRVGSWHSVVASVLLPGSGQWLQGRFTTGAVYFTAAALYFIFVLGPLIWAMDGPKMDVALSYKILVFGLWSLLCFSCAKDAYLFLGNKRQAARPQASP